MPQCAKRWLPPFKARRNFDACFDLAVVGSGRIALELDQGESTQAFRISHSAALVVTKYSKLKVILPTRRMVWGVCPPG